MSETIRPATGGAITIACGPLGLVRLGARPDEPKYAADVVVFLTPLEARDLAERLALRAAPNPPPTPVSGPGTLGSEGERSGSAGDLAGLARDLARALRDVEFHFHTIDTAGILARCPPEWLR